MHRVLSRADAAAPRIVAYGAFDACAAINDNDFSSYAAMQSAGWNHVNTGDAHLADMSHTGLSDLADQVFQIWLLLMAVYMWAYTPVRLMAVHTGRRPARAERRDLPDEQLCVWACLYL